MLFAALAMTLSTAQAAAPPPKPCTAPVHRQFDFWAGTWDVITAGGKFAGINRIEVVDGGCALSLKRSDGGWAEFGRSTLKRKP